MCDFVSLGGSPVEAYAALPAESELGVVRGLLADRRRVLDLGCGTGRIADPLAADGFDVVAVDESQKMVERVRRATGLRSSIETLNLGRHFDAVLLLSHLINGANAARLLSVVADHLEDGGVFVAQRLEPRRKWRLGSGQLGPVTVELVDVVVTGPRVEASTRYSVGECSWLQRWTLWERDDAEVRDLLRAAGLRLIAIDGP